MNCTPLYVIASTTRLHTRNLRVRSWDLIPRASFQYKFNRCRAPKRAEGNFGVFSYLESNTKILYNIEKSNNLLAFPSIQIMKQLDKFQFIYSILYKPCIFKAYRLLNVQTLCIFPCFCPYEPKQGKFLFSADYLIQQSCGSTLRFPCSVSVNVHCGTDISVSEKFLHIFRCCTV